MKIPVTWINESFKKDYSAIELSDLLTLSGIESEIQKDKDEEILDISLTPIVLIASVTKGLFKKSAH